MQLALRTNLEQWHNTTVHVRGRIADFGVGLINRRLGKNVTILIKDVEISKNGSVVKLSHLWIMPSREKVRYNLYVNDIIEFDGEVYCYRKFNKKNKFMRSYGVREIRHIHLYKESDSPQKSYLDALAQTI